MSAAENATIKVFQINECDWYAGATAEECVKVYRELYDGEPDYLDEFGLPKELDDATMNRLILRDTDSDMGGDKTFTEALKWMQEHGLKFPCPFASTEY